MDSLEYKYVVNIRQLTQKVKIQTILEEIGLSKTKALVYSAALQVGTGTVQEIALRAGLPRTTAHEVIAQLAALGLVSYTSKGKRRRYSAEPPDRLLRLQKEREEKIKQALPTLFSIFNTEGTQPRVRLYDGVEGIKTVFEDTLTASDKILRGILSMEDLYVTPGKEFMDNYVQRRVDAKIWLNVVRSKGKEVDGNWLSSGKELRELRYAPESMIFPATMYFYDNKIIFVGTKKENFGMIIESPELYTTQKNLFELLWATSSSQH